MRDQSHPKSWGEIGHFWGFKKIEEEKIYKTSIYTSYQVTKRPFVKQKEKKCNNLIGSDNYPQRNAKHTAVEIR